MHDSLQTQAKIVDTHTFNNKHFYNQLMQLDMHCKDQQIKKEILSSLVTDCNTIQTILSEMNSQETISHDFQENFQKLAHLDSLVKNLNSVQSKGIILGSQFQLSVSLQSNIQEVIHLVLSKLIRYLNQNMHTVDKHLLNQAIKILSNEEEQLIRFIKLFANFRAQEAVNRVYQTLQKQQETYDLMAEFYQLLDHEFQLIENLDLEYFECLKLTNVFQKSVQIVKEHVDSQLDRQNDILEFYHLSNIIEYFSKKLMNKFEYSLGFENDFKIACATKMKVALSRASQEITQLKFNLKNQSCYEPIQNYMKKVSDMIHIKSLQKDSSFEIYSDFEPVIFLQPSLLLRPMNDLYQIKLEKANFSQLYIFVLNLDTIILQQIKEYSFFEEEVTKIQERQTQNMDNLIKSLVQEKLVIQKLQNQNNFVNFIRILQQEYLDDISLKIQHVTQDFDLFIEQNLTQQTSDLLLVKFLQYNEEIVHKLEDLFVPEQTGPQSFLDWLNENEGIHLSYLTDKESFILLYKEVSFVF